MGGQIPLDETLSLLPLLQIRGMLRALGITGNGYLRNIAHVVLPRTKSGTTSPSCHGTLRMCRIKGFCFWKYYVGLVNIWAHRLTCTGFTIMAYCETELGSEALWARESAGEVTVSRALSLLLSRKPGNRSVLFPPSVVGASPGTASLWALFSILRVKCLIREMTLRFKAGSE